MKLLKRQQLYFVWFIIAFAIIGKLVIFRGFAADPVVSFEPENAVLGGSVTAGTDTTASGGKFIQFGSSSTAGGGTTTTSGEVTLPTRAAFYYPWFPETWSVNGAHVAYSPTLGYYDSSTTSVVDSHIASLDYAKVKVGIASWWGPGTHNESTRIPLLLQETTKLNAGVRWSLYYEKEGNTTTPSGTEIASDLAYIKNNYVDNATYGSSYARVGGKPVIFMYNVSDNTCASVDKIMQANANYGFYVVMKVFPGYASCATQPSSWHQYSPAVAVDSQAGYSYTISPGFWRADEATARLPRLDPSTTWVTNVKAMTASKAPWQLVTTFNEWGEGTAVESADSNAARTGWATSSTQGAYLDALHNN